MTESPRILSRDDFLSGTHLKRELVDVPELGGAVYLRELSTPQLLLLRERMNQARGADGRIDDVHSLQMMAFVLSLSACDDTGAPLFTVEDLEPLMHNKISVLERLGNQVLAISGIDLDVAAVANNLKKNQTPSSSSGSPRSSGKRRRRS